MGQGDPGVELEMARTEVIQNSPMSQCLGTTGNLKGSSPEASQIKRQKLSASCMMAYGVIFKEFLK